jgi:hypothetical protein
VRTTNSVFSFFWKLSLTLLVFSNLGAASAESFPPEGRETLEDVLSRPEFASSSQALSDWERLKQEISAQAGRALKSVIDAFDFPDVNIEEDSWINSLFEGIAVALGFLAELIEWFFSVAPALLFATIGGLGAYAVYRVYRHRQGTVAWRKGEYSGDSVNESPLSLSELLESRDYTAMLEGLRRRFREQYLKTYSIPLSMTDRRVLCEIPMDAENYSLFADTVELFEAIAFADADLEKERILALTESVVAA